MSEACVLCRSADFENLESGILDYEYLSPGEYRWLKCKNCELITIDPKPSSDILAKAYPVHYHAYVNPSSSITKKLIQISRANSAKQIRKLCSNLDKNSKPIIMDIGCSDGSLLAEIQMDNKYDLIGVEYNLDKANEASAKGIKVYQGDFEAVDIPNNSVDVIIMNHLLEHVYNPKDTLNKAYEVLKPGGTILGQLPNIDSWDAALFGKYWGGGHAPRHIYHFTPITLDRCLKETGFSDIKIKPALHTGHWALSFQNFFRRNLKTEIGLKNGRTWYYPLFLMATIPVNIFAMFFKKTGVMDFCATK